MNDYSGAEWGFTEDIFTKEEVEKLCALDEDLVDNFKKILFNTKERKSPKDNFESLIISFLQNKDSRAEIFKPAMLRHIKKIYTEGGFEAVETTFKTELKNFIMLEYEDCSINTELASFFKPFFVASEKDPKDIKEGEQTIFFEAAQLKTFCQNHFSAYFDLFKEEPEKIERLNAILNETVYLFDYVFEIPTDPEARSLESIKTSAAKNVVFLGDKISQYIFDPTLSQPLIALDRQKKDIASIKLSNAVETDIQLFYKDKMTLEAIIALHEAGNRFITYGMICRAMNPNAAKITEVEIADTRNRVNKLRLTDMELLFKRPKKIKDSTITQYKGYLLNATEWTFIANGKESQGIKINEPLLTSWLYLWASYTGELHRTPINLIATKIGNYDYSAALKNYLLRRITSMKKAPKLKRIILIKTVMDNILDEKTYTESRLKHVRANIIQSTKEYLEELQTNGEISGYEIIKKGNAVSAVKIKFRA